MTISDPVTPTAAKLAAAGASGLRIAPSVARDPYGSVRVFRSVDQEMDGYDWMKDIPLIGDGMWNEIRKGIVKDIREHPTRLVWDPRWPFAWTTAMGDTGQAIDKARMIELYGSDVAAAAKKRAYYLTDSSGRPKLAYGWDKLE